MAAESLPEPNKEVIVNKRKEKSSGDLLLDLVVSDINLARAFAAVARSAYASGRLAEGESARLKTMRFYCQALRSLLQMSERDRKSFLTDIQTLRVHIEWLSLQSGESCRSSSESHEDASMKNLLKLLEGQG
jgi:hypothetical protein